MLRFLLENPRWVFGGFLLTFCSSFGQTFFISLSAGDIRQEFGLSHGAWGALYMLATIGSALSLPKFGQIVDKRSVQSVSLLTIPVLAVAAAAMAFAQNVAMLLLAIYLLRLFGQGMMTHIALTAMGRWFSAQRGKAVSLVVLGQNAGEALFPLAFVSGAAILGWRNAWLAGAALLVLLALPAVAGLLAVERAPRSSDPRPKQEGGRDWTRAEVLRDGAFYLLLLGVLAPPFIGTVVFFHQIYLAELRGWPVGLIATAFPVMAVLTASFALISGQLIDRYSAVSLLPSFLLPLGLACLVIAFVPDRWAVFAFMALLGMSWGFSSTLFGAVWPEIYGIRHLGAIRSSIVAVMVLATALGPGLTGALIDLGVSYPAQIAVMGLYCLVVSGVLLVASRRIRTRLALATTGG
ncbi:MAG TPA: MFS transporter [Mesorhizobium sp.]|jgi:MFS family permease|nr:MFS transporter [Mesorhizobium sp.]